MVLLHRKHNLLQLRTEALEIWTPLQQHSEEHHPIEPSVLFCKHLQFMNLFLCVWTEWWFLLNKYKSFDYFERVEVWVLDCLLQNGCWLTKVWFYCLEQHMDPTEDIMDPETKISVSKKSISLHLLVKMQSQKAFLIVILFIFR